MRVEGTRVDESSVEVLLKAEPGEALRTSDYPGLRERALVLLPGLSLHRCDNPEGRRFLDELADTEVAHLFEHIAVELMALAGSPRTLRGETSWDFARDGRGVFRVRFAFDNDLVALGAVKAAADIVRALEAEEESRAEVLAAVERLQKLRDD